MAEDILTTLSKLPAMPAITYRGMAGPRPNASFTLSGILPTSMDPRVASENFTAEWLAAIVSITSSQRMQSRCKGGGGYRGMASS